MLKPRMTWKELCELSPIEIPETISEEERQAIITAFLQGFSNKYLGKRPKLTVAQLQEMKDPVPHLELTITDLDLWIFTVDGTVELQRVEGATLGGAPGVVCARTEGEAYAMMRSAIETTAQAADQWAFASMMGCQNELMPEKVNEGVVIATDRLH